MFNDDEYDEAPPTLVPCHTCGRNFSEHAIQRHAKICQKVTSKKRNIFDSHSQRKVEDSTGGGSLSIMVSKKYSNSRVTNNRANQQQKRASPKEVPLPKSNWKQKHEDFIRTVRAARQATTAVKQGKPLPPPPPAAINPDYIQCPHCQRRFNQSAAERHITFCAEQRKRLGANAKHQQASAAMKARTKYKPPALKTRSAPAPTGAQHPGRPQPQQRALNGTANPTQHGEKRAGVAFSRPPVQQRRSSDRSQQNGGSGNQRRLAPQSSQRRTAPKAEWDSSIEESPAQRTRTKTGLKPVNSGGSTRVRKASPARMTEVKQPAVRKIARAPRSQPYYADVKRRPSPSEEEGQIRDTPKYGSRDDNSYHPSAYTPTATTNPPPAANPNQRYGVKKPVRVSPASYKHNNGSSAGALRGNVNVVRGNYCQECGSKFPVVNAKFCCECGMRRFSLHD